MKKPEQMMRSKKGRGRGKAEEEGKAGKDCRTEKSTVGEKGEEIGTAEW